MFLNNLSGLHVIWYHQLLVYFSDLDLLLKIFQEDFSSDKALALLMILWALWVKGVNVIKNGQVPHLACGFQLQFLWKTQRIFFSCWTRKITFSQTDGAPGYSGSLLVLISPGASTGLALMRSAVWTSVRMPAFQEKINTKGTNSK